MTASPQKRSSPDTPAVPPGHEEAGGQPSPLPEATAPRRAPLGPRIMALFILAVGLTVLIGAFLIPEGGGYQAVGPRPFPILVGAAGTLIGAIGVVQTFLGHRLAALRGSVPGHPARGEEPARHAEPTGPGEPGDRDEPTGQPEQASLPAPRWRPTLTLLGVLVTYALVMPTAGYWQATTVLYAAAARIQGSRKPVRDALIGLVLALVTYFVFDRLFGIDLPPGYLRLAF